MHKSNGFQKGSGCYTCNCCGRKTRSTGNGDNEWVGLCEQCYEIGGIENQMQNRDFEGEAGKQALIDEIKALIAIVEERGGKVTSDFI